jgi:hypothetical protein
VLDVVATMRGALGCCGGLSTMRLQPSEQSGPLSFGTVTVLL